MTRVLEDVAQKIESAEIILRDRRIVQGKLVGMLFKTGLAYTNFRNPNLKGLSDHVKSLIMRARAGEPLSLSKTVMSSPNNPEKIELGTGEAGLEKNLKVVSDACETNEESCLFLETLIKKIRLALDNLHNPNLEMFDETVKESIVNLRKAVQREEFLEMLKKGHQKSPPNSDRNNEYLTTSEPETDADSEPELVEQVNEDSAPSALAPMTSSPSKFAILIVVPIFLAILFYFVPLDFLKFSAY